MTKRRLRVGITGGIGSGKSAVTDRLAARGITIVDADLIAREVVAKDTPALKAIAKRFGDAVLQSDETLDRAALREIVFSKPSERQWLESLTHPLIRTLIERRMNEADGKYVVLSSPLLLEGGQVEYVDTVVVVDVPEDLQVARTMRRDQNNEQLVRSIMDAQLARSERLARADRVVVNDGTLEDLDARVDTLHQDLLSDVRILHK